MSKISNKKRKFIKRNFKQLSLEELAHKTGLTPKTVRSLIDEYTDKTSDKNHLISKNLSSIIYLDNKRWLCVTGIVALTVFLLTLMVYIPALENDFVCWDDNEYVYENTRIQSLNLHSLSEMFTSFHAANWHPLTWLSHALDYALWGLDPGRHHLTSIVLHGLNTLLVFFLALRLIVAAKRHDKDSSTLEGREETFPPALLAGGITALLFGLHPLHVESVAWISERKDLLCALFFLLSVIFYLSYVSSALFTKRLRGYIMSLLLFAFALMSKPMAVTLPVVLLVLDIYPLKRGRGRGGGLSVVLEKIPYFALSIASGIVTIIAQRSGGALIEIERLSLSGRVLNALNSIVFYLGKMVWPFKLVPFYPFPHTIYPLDPRYLIAGILGVAITGWCLWMVTRGTYLFFTVWCYYLVTLLPVLGIIQVGNQAAADRYTYLPSIGPFLLAGIGVAWVWQRASLTGGKKVVRGLILTFTLLLVFITGGLSVTQGKVWRNSESLWRYVINAFPGRVPVAHNNLGIAYSDKGMLDEAISQYKKSLTINPGYLKAYVNLAAAYNDKGMFDEAIVQCEKAHAINPNFAEIHYNLGLAYDKKGEPHRAISQYKKALELNPEYLNAHVNLGAVYSDSGMLDEAIAELRKALSVRPTLTEIHYNLGIVYGKKGMVAEAISAFRTTLALNPNFAHAHYRLAVAYYSKGEYKLAIAHCDEATQRGLGVPPQFLNALAAYR